MKYQIYLWYKERGMDYLLSVEDLNNPKNRRTEKDLSSDGKPFYLGDGFDIDEQYFKSPIFDSIEEAMNWYVLLGRINHQLNGFDFTHNVRAFI